MAEKVISTLGVADKFVTSCLMGYGATESDKNGRFYLDGSMVNVELSQTIAEVLYIDEIFRDGQSVTGKYAVDGQKNGAVRVMLDQSLPFSSRTLSYGGRHGTDGNAGAINSNSPMLPNNDEFMIYLNQINDQMLLFPEVSMNYIPLDVAGKKIAGYAKRVGMDRSASILAEIIAYNAFRALNSGNNIITISDITADGAIADAIGDLHTALDNGDVSQGAYQYATDGRTIIGRPSFVNKILNKKSGVVLLGGDLAQAMLRDYNLGADVNSRNYVGTNYKGYVMGVHIQSCPDAIWTLAEKYLGLTAGALDDVYAIGVSYEANAVVRNVDLGVKMVDAQEVRGVKAQPLNLWGMEAFRKSYFIGNSSFNTSALSSMGFSADVRKYPVAPKTDFESDKILVPVYGTDGTTIIGYREIANVPKPNGDNIQSGARKVAKPVASEETQTFEESLSVELSTVTSGADIYYTVDGSTPTASSTKYTSAITISATTTLKAIAIKSGAINSAILTETYTKAESVG